MSCSCCRLLDIAVQHCGFWIMLELLSPFLQLSVNGVGQKKTGMQDMQTSNRL